MRTSLLLLLLSVTQLLQAQSRFDPYKNFKFQVVLNSTETVLNFSEVKGLGIEQDVIEYQSGAEANTVRRMSGMQKFGNITLKRGTFAHSPRMTNYFKAVSVQSVKKETIKIHMIDKMGRRHLSWILHNARPMKYKGAELDASGGEVAMEELTIAHEGLRRVQ